MKKIISLGIASAVLAMTAISASAAVTVNGDANAVQPGQDFTVTFVTDAEIPAVEGTSGISFNVNATGAQLQSTQVASTGFGMFSDTSNTYAFVNTGATPAGFTLLTATFTVTAAEGEAVSVTVDSVDGAANTTGTPFVATAITVEQDPGNEPGEEPGNEPGEEPGEEPGGEEPGDGNDNPNSGIALAVFPAIVAGAAAVVVAKKRK